jgi:hypothetical protein
MCESNFNSGRYIIPDKIYCQLENKSIQLQSIYNITNNSVLNIVDGIVGFTGSIQNAGCTAEIVSQENHILEAFGGSVSPKNIVIQTDGFGNIYGSFFRDDTLTFPKGDVRGSGANDLSVYREECSQVASGDFSSILGGKNNTASGELSIVLGGDNNISSGLGSVILGGNNNVNVSEGSIVSGTQNTALSGGSGGNIIGNGINHTISGGYNSILNGDSNIIQDSTSKFNTILGGIQNKIDINSSNSFIATGQNNFVSGDYNTIISGQGNTAISGGSGGNFIGSGCNNFVTGGFNAIVVGTQNKIDISNSFYNSILSGSNNRIDAVSRNSIIGSGQNNTILNSNSAIMCGFNNTISLDGASGGNFIGGGTGNFISGNYNAILNGENNRIDSSQCNFNAILNGSSNNISGLSDNSSISSGQLNRILNKNSGIVSGFNNTIQSGGTGGNFIGGGTGNFVNGSFNAILVGTTNRINNENSSNSAIIGGLSNNINLNVRNSMIGAGQFNIIEGDNGAIIAGTSNYVGGTASFIGAGLSGYVIGTGNAILGGASNSISNSLSSFNVILSGVGNNIQSGISNSIIGAGSNNRVSASFASIIAGSNNVINGPTGLNSTIAGGISNVISIPNSFVCGEGLELTQTNHPSAAFGRFNLEGSTGTGATAGFRIFMVGIGTGVLPAQRRNGFSVNDKGLCIANNGFVTGGADFAEYFESYSIYNEKLPYCEPVCLIDNRFLGNIIDPNTRQFIPSIMGFTNSDIGKIMLSTDVPDEVEPFGVVVSNSGFIGNAHEESWSGKYEKDINGTPIYTTQTIEKEIEDTTTTYEQVERIEVKTRTNLNGDIEYYQEKKIESIPIINPIFEEYPLYDLDNNFIGLIKKPKIKKVYETITTQNISQNFNPNLVYIPRSQRPEWNLIAILGQVLIKNNRRLSSKWKKMRHNQEQSNYFIK